MISVMIGDLAREVLFDLRKLPGHVIMKAKLTHIRPKRKRQKNILKVRLDYHRKSQIYIST